jgi:hypothetical protein
VQRCDRLARARLSDKPVYRARVLHVWSMVGILLPGCVVHANCNLVCVSSSLESRRHALCMVWSHRADLGGVGTTHAMHGPRTMVASWSQDLWAAGVELDWALRLPGQPTQGRAGRHLAAFGEGGDSAKRRAASNRNEIRELIQQEQQQERRSRRRCVRGSAALRVSGSTDHRH